MFEIVNPDIRLSASTKRALARLLLESELSSNIPEDEETTTVITIEVRRKGEQPTPAKPKVESPYLTVAEAATYCRRSPKTILNHHSLGNIRSMPGTRPPLFRREELDEWLSTRRKSRKN
jgi:hypothetical protein